MSAEWKQFNSTSSNYNGDVSSVANASVGSDAGANYIIVSQTAAAETTIRCLTSTGANQTGPFSTTINFPTVRLRGNLSSSTDGVLGVRMTVDGIITDEFILWSDLIQPITDFNGPEGLVINPSFTFTGNATSSVTFTPFMTKASQVGTITQSFMYLMRGSYLVNFHKLV